MALTAKKMATQRFTYADYLTWSDDERWEIIDGVAYNMTPAPGSLHQELAGLLTAELISFFRGKPCKVFAAPFDVRLPLGDEDDEDLETVVQPDISVICDKKKIDSRGCRGAPDLAVEILSESSAERDLFEKRFLYERSRVKEYWVISPKSRTLSIFRLEKAGVFGRELFLKSDAFLSTPLFPGLEISLSRVFPEPNDEVHATPGNPGRKRK